MFQPCSHVGYTRGSDRRDERRAVPVNVVNAFPIPEIPLNICSTEFFIAPKCAPDLCFQPMA